METGQLQDVNQVVNVFEDRLTRWRSFSNGLDEDDYKAVQYAIMTLLYKKGFVDGTLIEEYGFYRVVDKFSKEINEYINMQGMCLHIDDDNKLIWAEMLPEFELCTPYSKRFMSANHLILLSVLLQRYLADNSTKDIIGNNISGVLVSEKDIVTDMLPYMKNSDDNAKRYKDAVSAINFFCTELGLLKLIWTNNSQNTDGSASKVYRISPYIGIKFNVVEMDRLIETVKASFANNVSDTTDSTDIANTAEIEENAEEKEDD